MERDNDMHGARTAMNRVPEIREWVENYLKTKHRDLHREMSDSEFETYWKYHKPEIIHAESAEGVHAYKEREA